MIKNNNNLKKWLEEKLPHLGNLNKIEKFDVGQSNPTYLLYCENKKRIKSFQHKIRTSGALYRCKCQFCSIHQLCFNRREWCWKVNTFTHRFWARKTFKWRSFFWEPKFLGSKNV